MAISHKVCPRCGELKSNSKFGKNATLPDGLAFYCRACFRAAAKAQYRTKRGSQGYAVRPRVKAPEGQKWCPDCKKYLLIDDFARNAAARDGRNTYCRQHHVERGKRTYFLRKYGIEQARVDEMRADQDDRCLICQRDLVGKGHVDHDHKTGVVR